jgi:predicted esterase
LLSLILKEFFNPTCARSYASGAGKIKESMNRFLFYSLVFLTAALSEAGAQQVFKTTPNSVIGYLEYLPQGYHNNSDKYPIMIFLHGIGERGPNSTDPAILSQSIQNVAKHGPPKYVKLGSQFPFILISPQLKNNYGTWPSAYVMEVINYCKTYLRIDERRIYLTGLSLGGGGTWVAAQDYPELFAAIAPVCGGYNSPSLACKLAGEDLPVWAFHGDKDTVVPLSKSQNMVNAINACVPKPSPLAMLSIYPGVAHNAWDNAYRIDSVVHNPNVYKWILSYKNLYNKDNMIPIANAGADRIVTGLSTTLTGSATDADGSIQTYTWTLMSGGTATLTNATTSTLSLSNLAVGDYVFRLQVKDNSGNTDSDYIKITVTNQPNVAPVSKAGPNQSITLPVHSLIINGEATDSDGVISSYKWSKVSGATVTMANTASKTLTVSNMVEGSYTFRLAVTDDDGAIGSDDVIVTVNAPVVPVVNAGKDKLIRLPSNSAMLYGSATDEGGTITSYQWTLVSGASCTMTNASTATLKASGLAAGRYVFRLTATDNDGYSSSDEVTVTVSHPPVVEVGADKTIKIPATFPIYISASASDPDGSVVKFAWSKMSGPNYVVENGNTSTLKINVLYEGVYVLRLAVTDNAGLVTHDHITLTVKPKKAPVVSAGTDKLLRLPSNSAVFYGSASDEDGTIDTYQWTQTSGVACTMTNATTASMKASNLAAGTYSFQLQATDNDGLSSYDDVTVIVSHPPTVDVGPDKVITLPATFPMYITGVASDPDGSIVKYLWTKSSGPNYIVEGTNTATLKINKLYEGVYSLRLAVTDNVGLISYDYITLTVKTGVVTAARTSSEVEVLTEEQVSGIAGTSSGESDVEIFNDQLLNSEKVNVVVYNGNGEQLYTGGWSADVEHNVFRQGLYIVHIHRDGKLLGLKKIFKH